MAHYQDSVHTLTCNLGTVGAPTALTILKKSVVTVKESEGGKVNSMTLNIFDASGSLSIVPWREIRLIVDDGEAGEETLFGGYVARRKYAEFSPGGRTIALTCEGWEVDLRMESPQHRSWTDETPGQMIADVFGDADNLSAYDVTTYVTAGSSMESFSIGKEERISAWLDRLAALLGLEWVIDSDQYLHFGAPASHAAPFGITDGANEDHGSDLYAVKGGSVSVGDDASDIKNRVVVVGGISPSDEVTDNFTGDGSTVRFNLSHRDIIDIVEITVAGVAYNDGTVWWHGFGDKQVLTNYGEGWIEFATAPGNSVAIAAVYHYGEGLTYTDSNSASITFYGKTFTHVEINSRITSEDQATMITDAILAAYAYGATVGIAEVRRFGLRAGQELPVYIPTYGVDDDYVIRSCMYTFQLAPSGVYMTCVVNFGGRTKSLSQLITDVTRQPVFQLPGTPQIYNSIGESRLVGTLQIGTGTPDLGGIS